MSEQYPGGFITKNPPIPTSSAAPGLWTLSQQAFYRQNGDWPQFVVNYIEDVFSTYLYSGNSGTLTINNGIDLAGKGGLIWFKGRSGSGGTWSHALFDTARGANLALATNLSNGNLNWSGSLSSFGSAGFTLGTDSAGVTNTSGNNYASWAFRKAEKFFDIVTYTGDGTNYRNIPHNLKSTPGCIILKHTSANGNNWRIWHRSLTPGYMLAFTTDGQYTDLDLITGATSSTFEVGTRGGNPVNGSGQTYVAYVFAHNAGSFGLSNTDNVISCGSYVGTGAAGNAVTLGYEPQWLLVKNITTAAQNWEMFDNMRGLPTVGSSSELFPNTNTAERAAFNIFNVTPTGFVTGTSALDETNKVGDTYVYMAVRRGLMKTPTDATKVYQTLVRAGTSTTVTVSTNITADFMFEQRTDGGQPYTIDRLRGGSQYTNTSQSAAEGQQTTAITEWGNFYLKMGSGAIVNDASYTGYTYHMFRRAASFFDEVCYTGTGVARTVAHNLTVAPELMIVKSRSIGTESWAVYFGDPTDYLRLNDPQAAVDDIGRWNDTAPTSTVFTVGSDPETNSNGATYVAYLFATIPNVSKVGTYTGTGTTQQINCGFTGGARFILIKSIGSVGDWYVWDSTRGIVAGNDPYMLLNTSAAQVTGTDYVDTHPAGFEITSTAPAAINANGISFLFLAIA